MSLFARRRLDQVYMCAGINAQREPRLLWNVHKALLLRADNTRRVHVGLNSAFDACTQLPVSASIEGSSALGLAGTICLGFALAIDG